MESLEYRGQKVLGEMADGRILLVVTPRPGPQGAGYRPDGAVFAPFSVSISQEDGYTPVRCVRPSTLLIFFEQAGMQNILMEIELRLWNSLVEDVPDGRIESRQPALPPETGQALTAQGLPGDLNALEGEYARSK